MVHKRGLQSPGAALSYHLLGIESLNFFRNSSLETQLPFVLALVSLMTSATDFFGAETKYSEAHENRQGVVVVQNLQPLSQFLGLGRQRIS